MTASLHRTARLCTLLLAAAMAGCSDSPSEPADDVNPALVAEASDAGFGTSTSMPQGSAPFTGPGGIIMDASAEEFVQQLTRRDGVVWKTSGIKVTAVPDEDVSNAPFAAIGFGAAHTGSLASVEMAAYPTVAEYPVINFVDRQKFGFANLRVEGTRDYTLAHQGTVTIESVEYFRDTYTCELPSIRTLGVERCDYQVGVLRGTVEFSATLPDGTDVVQQSSPFSVPIMRRTIVLREK